jgi:hypothetical protein
MGHAVQQVARDMPAALRWLESAYEGEVFERVEVEP